MHQEVEYAFRGLTLPLACCRCARLYLSFFLAMVDLDTMKEGSPTVAEREEDVYGHGGQGRPWKIAPGKQQDRF